MSPRKTADQWFAEYGESHQHRTNEVIHWVCVPVIFGSVLGFVSLIPVPDAWADAMPWFDWSIVAIALVSIFYLRMSPALTAGLVCFMTFCYAFLIATQLFFPWPVWRIYAPAFVFAWIGQFIGHRIEGKRPSFFSDLVFLLIGPAWLMSRFYKKVGQRY